MKIVRTIYSAFFEFWLSRGRDTPFVEAAFYSMLLFGVNLATLGNLILATMQRAGIEVGGELLSVFTWGLVVSGLTVYVALLFFKDNVLDGERLRFPTKKKLWLFVIIYFLFTNVAYFLSFFALTRP